MARAGDAAADFVLSLLGPHPRSPEAVDWDEVHDLLALHGLRGLAFSAGRERTGLLPEEVHRRIAPAHRAAELTTTLLLEAGEEARKALREAGIPSLYFKGAALVRSGAYPDPGARPMDDVDLLVREEYARAAVSVLERAGFQPWAPWQEGREEWLDSFSFLGPEAPGGLPLALDLHWRTDYGELRFGSAGRDSVLWEGARAVEGLPAPERHLVIVLEHVLKHMRYQVHFRGLADVSVLAGAVRDWDQFLEVAKGRRQARALGLLLDLCREDLGLAVPPQALSVLRADGVWMEGARALIRPRRLLGRERPVNSRLAGLFLRGLLSGSPVGAVADLGRAAFPSGRWLRARYGDSLGEASTLGLRLRYLGDLVRWVTYRGRSPASPNQDLLDPRARW